MRETFLKETHFPLLHEDSIEDEKWKAELVLKYYFYIGLFISSKCEIESSSEWARLNLLLGSHFIDPTLDRYCLCK